MKKTPSCLFAAVVALGLLGGARASAEDVRVVEEEIVLLDPTVSAPLKWAAGASGEYWYIAGPYKTRNGAGEITSKGSISGKVPGGSFFIGYDKWTLQYSHREGVLRIHQTDVDNANIITNSEDKQIEEEVTLRYLMKGGDHFSPYLLVGYNETSLSVKTTLDPPYVYTYNLTDTYRARTTYTSGLVGLGAIVPLNRTIGFRADGRLLYTSATYRRDDDRNTLRGSGVGGAATGTLYVNIARGLNVQAGLKGQVLNGGKKVGAYGRAGMFASAGYSYKF